MIAHDQYNHTTDRYDRYDRIDKRWYSTQQYNSYNTIVISSCLRIQGSTDVDDTAHSHNKQRDRQTKRQTRVNNKI